VHECDGRLNSLCFESLSYASTMEVLETARVDAYCTHDVVVPASRRRDVLVVVWEGTCMERKKSRNIRLGMPDFRTLDTIADGEPEPKKRPLSVWYAGDWTGPRSLQPDKYLSGDSHTSESHDVVAMSSEGVKVITIEFKSLHTILRTGSPLYRQYLQRKSHHPVVADVIPRSAQVPENLLSSLRRMNVVELLDSNSALRKLSAVQKRHLESLAEGPVYFGPGQRLWRAGAAVDKAFLVVAGTVSFVPRRRNAGSVGVGSQRVVQRQQVVDDGKTLQKSVSIGEAMRMDAAKAIQELGPSMREDDTGSNMSGNEPEKFELTSDNRDVSFQDVFCRRGVQTSLTDGDDYAILSRGLQKRADAAQKRVSRWSASTDASFDAPIFDLADSQSSIEGETTTSMDHLQFLDNPISILNGDNSRGSIDAPSRSLLRRRSSRDRFANKVLGRLYSRRAFTAGLVFSRGHFLGDVSKMVAGNLSSEFDKNEDDDFEGEYGFGEVNRERRVRRADSTHGIDSVIHEREGDEQVVHSSTLAAGKEGCLVLYFPKASLIPFLDEYPGLLLSLLGTQVVV